MTFGQIIKQKRKEKDWTQEELAGMLRVSAQAVSRWETGDAMPDISLLAPIANLLEVSTDTLLGVDLSKKKQQIEDYSNRSSAILTEGGFTQKNMEKAIEILREGLRRFPDSDLLRTILICRLLGTGKEEDAREAARLCEEIFAQTDNLVTELNTLTLYTQNAKRLGYEKRALELINKFPNILTTSDQLRVRCQSGEEQDETYRRILNHAFIAMGSALHHFTCNSEHGTAEERLHYHRMYEKIEKMLYPDDLTATKVHDACQVARALTKAGDTEHAIEYLLRETAVLEDKTPIREISSLRPEAAFYRKVYAEIDYFSMEKENAETAQWTLDYIDKEMPEDVLNHPKMPEIRERLTVLASLLDKA